MRSVRTLLGLLSVLAICSCAATAPDAYAERSRPAKPVPSSTPTDRQWEHDWVRDAVFYEIFVRSFADSNGDGVGDFEPDHVCGDLAEAATWILAGLS